MRRRALYALAALLAVAVGVAFYYWRRGPAVVTTPPTNADGPAAAAATPGVVIVDATPLPAAFESPGLVSRRFGPLRLYVSAAPEVSLTKAAGTANAGSAGASLPEGERLASVPIRVVLENDSYREVDARRDLSLAGEELFQVSVSRADSGVIFNKSYSAAETVWEPAERKTFDLSWQPRDAGPGEYVVTVKLAFGDPGEVRIRTRLK